MKRIIVGALCALVAWMIGTQFDPWYVQVLGPVVAFVLGLVFEDLAVTKRVLADCWHKFMDYEWDWLGFAKYYGTMALSAIVVCSWWFVATIPNTRGLDPWECIFGTLSLLASVVVVLTALSGGIAQRPSDDIVRMKEHQKETVTAFLKACAYLNPISVAIILVWAVVTSVWFGTKLLCRFMISLPARIRQGFWASIRFSQFLFYSFVTLVAREKTLTFAICVTVGTGAGMLLGRTVICGVVAALTASILVLASDQMREWAKSRLLAMSPA